MNPKGLFKRLLLRYGGWEAEALLHHRRTRNASIFAEARDLSREVEPGSVLVLAPHPDDEAIGAGGTILAHRMAGQDVAVLYLTDGSAGKHLPGMVETRRAEARAVGEHYGIQQIFWDEPDTRLRSSPELANRLARVLRRFQPRHLYVPSFFEKHADHFIANQLALDALARYEPKGINLLGYEVWNNIIAPNYHLDVSAVFERKKEMLSFYRTPMQHTDYIRLCEARNALHHFLQCFGLTNGYAEAFFRADAVTYESHYSAYLEVLRITESSLVKRLTDA